MRLVLLGTSAGVPTRERGLSAAALQLGGRAWLVDCGEGTQRQMLRTGLRPTRIDRILITHLHGDHCWGLPGLLASIGMHGRSDPIEVAGPEGLREWLETTLRISATRLPYRLELKELGARGGTLADRDGIRVEAWPLRHRVSSFAWVVREPSRRGSLDVARAVRLGVPKGPLLGRLAEEKAVVLDEGRRVEPDEVLGPERPGRVAVLCGDSADSRILASTAPECDLLVHECTFAPEEADRARLTGHSSGRDVIELARAVRPRILVLTHWSPRHTTSHGSRPTEDLCREIADALPGIRVIAGRDGLELDVPARED